MGFKRLVNVFGRGPCQVVRTGRRVVYRLLGWNPWQHVFLRGVGALCTMPMQRCPLQCRWACVDAGIRMSRPA